MRQGSASGSPFCSQAARTVTGMWFVFWVFFGVFFPSPSLKYREVCLQDKRTCQGHLKMCVVITKFLYKLQL